MKKNLETTVILDDIDPETLAELEKEIDEDYEDENGEFYDDVDADNKQLNEFEKEFEEAEERNGDYSDVWYDKEEVQKENTVKTFQFILKCLAVTICLTLIIFFMSRLHRSSTFTLTQYLPSMADKQKLLAQKTATEADYTPCVAVAGTNSETAAPHIVVDVDDGKASGTTQNDKSPLIQAVGLKLNN